jgi:hypothetical protein
MAGCTSVPPHILVTVAVTGSLPIVLLDKDSQYYFHCSKILIDFLLYAFYLNAPFHHAGAISAATCVSCPSGAYSGREGTSGEFLRAESSPSPGLPCLMHVDWSDFLQFRKGGPHEYFFVLKVLQRAARVFLAHILHSQVNWNWANISY